MTDTGHEVIRSSENRALKLIRSLRVRKVREAERAFVVEGVRAVEDALVAGGVARVVLVRDGAGWRPPDSAGSLPIRRVDAALFDPLSETLSPQPVLAVFEWPELPLPELVEPLVLLIDGVRDPGNLGTLIRSAAGVGAAAAFLTEGTVDPYNGKVVRAGMGAHFRFPIAEFDESSQTWLRDRCTRFVLAEADSNSVYSEIDWRGPITLIVGSEADGPSAVGKALATESVRIPLKNGVESLNAGVAGSIVLFEAARQRSHS